MPFNNSKISLSARRSIRKIEWSHKRQPQPLTLKSFQVPLKQDTNKLDQTTFNRPKSDITDEKQQYINPENIIKALDNGHALVMVILIFSYYEWEIKKQIKLFQLKRTRVKGFCVECIKKSGDPAYKKTMTKIITYCPQCPVSNFI